MDKVQRSDSIESIETQLRKIRCDIDKLETRLSAPIPETIVAAGDNVTFNENETKVISQTYSVFHFVLALVCSWVILSATRYRFNTTNDVKN